MDIQIFDRNQSITIDEGTRGFMVEIRALVFYVQIGILKEPDSLTPTVTALLPACDASLCDTEGSLRRAEVARIGNDLAVTQRGEISKSEVNSHVFVGGW